jgi:hypothetical protein
MGASYADNAGATGDLTLALYNNNRRWDKCMMI